VVEWDDPAFEGWVERMGKGEGVHGVRAVVVLDVWKVSLRVLFRYQSCS